jgi:hypothetical protein
MFTVLEIYLKLIGGVDADFEIEFHVGERTFFTFEDKSEVNINMTDFGDGLHVFNALSVLSVEQKKRTLEGENRLNVNTDFGDVLEPFAKAIEETGRSLTV